MKQLYKTAALLLITGGLMTQANAQTHYGVGVGISGDKHTFFGKNAGKISSGANNVFVGQEAGLSNTSGSENIFIGTQAGYSNTLGSNNAFVGFGAGYTNTTGEKNTYLGYASGGNANLVNATAIGAQAKVNPVWFRYNGKAEIKTGDKKFVGIIAQDMQKIAPYTIGSFNYQDSLGNKTEYLDNDANAVTYILINSVKEQQKLIDDKDAEIQQLDRDVSDLKQRLEKLESLLKSTAVISGNNLAASKESADGVVLEQNAPNPVAKSAVIRFYIPQSVKSATLQVHNNDGVKIGAYPIEERGSGQFTFHANTLNSGIYLYDLITDGKTSGAKKMVITK